MTRDWGGFGAIRDEAKQLADDERRAPLVDCPICGTPLDENSRREKNCPLGHFRAPAGARRADYA